jgi:mannosyltransferase OCH1-like enzyme
MGNLSGFKVIEVNLSNIHNYLETSTLKKITYSLNNAKVKIYAQSQGDLYRLALLEKYGGIYMDASYIAL